MSSHIQSRRSFLTSTGIATIALGQGLRSVSRGDEPKQDQLPHMGLIIPGVRENVADMDDNHPTIKSYHKAVKAMKKLKSTDPLSWTFQANMHGVPQDRGDHAAWKWCQHGNWWFLPWHRGYLYFFELIVRKMSEDDQFRLPYWAWEQPGQNVLPMPFRNPGTNRDSNPLHDESRSSANSGKPIQPGGRNSSGSFYLDWMAAKRKTKFTHSEAALSYGGLKQPRTVLPAKPNGSEHGGMESNAHDLIHVAVNGRMGDPATAAQDPIFWLHHANVDRLWNRWLDVRGHDLPSDKDWYDQEFPFYNEQGKREVMDVATIIRLCGLHYRYDDDERVPLIAMAAQLPQEGEIVEPTVIKLASAQPMLALGTTPFTKKLSFADEAKPKLMAALSGATAQNVEPPAVILQVEGIVAPKTANVVYEVFVRKIGDDSSTTTYVGTISFFGRRKGDHGHDNHAPDGDGFTQGFEVTDVIEKLGRANNNTLPDLEVSIVPHSTNGVSDTDLVKEKIIVPIADVTLKLVSE